MPPQSPRKAWCGGIGGKGVSLDGAFGWLHPWDQRKAYTYFPYEAPAAQHGLHLTCWQARRGTKCSPETLGFLQWGEINMLWWCFLGGLSQLVSG